MKKLFVIVLAVLFLLGMCACTQEEKRESPATATPPDIVIETAKPDNITENSAYAAYAGYAEDAVGIILNEPFDGTEPTATVTWQEGEYDRLYLIPRYVGSVVEVFETNFVTTDGDLVMYEDPVFSTKVDDGCVIYSALLRPEGYDRYYIQITTPENETYGMHVSFNGNTGTPRIEVIGAEQ